MQRLINLYPWRLQQQRRLKKWIIVVMIVLSLSVALGLYGWRRDLYWQFAQQERANQFMQIQISKFNKQKALSQLLLKMQHTTALLQFIMAKRRQQVCFWQVWQLLAKTAPSLLWLTAWHQDKNDFVLLGQANRMTAVNQWSMQLSAEPLLQSVRLLDLQQKVERGIDSWRFKLALSGLCDAKN